MDRQTDKQTTVLTSSWLRVIKDVAPNSAATRLNCTLFTLDNCLAFPDSYIKPTGNPHGSLPSYFISPADWHWPCQMHLLISLDIASSPGLRSCSSLHNEHSQLHVFCTHHLSTHQTLTQAMKEMLQQTTVTHGE